MKLIRLHIILFSLIVNVVFSAEESSPDVVTKVATCAANWLKLETGTRAIAMGGAYTAAGNDLGGIPYNPASLAFIDNQAAFLSQTKYVADITYNVIGYGMNMSGTDFFGIHIFSLDSGLMDVTTEDVPDGTGEQFKVTGMCLRATYARRLTDRLRVGFTGKYIREDIYTTYMQTFAFDIGSNFNTGIYGFVLGMSVTNLGPEVQFGGEGLEIELSEAWMQNGNLTKITEKFPLPMTFRLGLSNEVVGPNSEFAKNKNHKVIISMDGINAKDYVLYAAVGLEYSWKDIAYVRAGNRLGHDTAKWSLGGGFNIDGKAFSVGLDYAYVNYSILNYTHQFGLNFEF
jgi:hypothetical protein